MFSSVEDIKLQQLALPKPDITVSRVELAEWKQRIFVYQSRVRSERSPQQPTLFELTFYSATSSPDPDNIDPFSLPPQNTEFWRWKVYDPGCAALYFVIDHELPILLYVGETVKSAVCQRPPPASVACCRQYWVLAKSTPRYSTPPTPGIGANRQVAIAV
jgi:hypothetical protein